MPKELKVSPHSLLLLIKAIKKRRVHTKAHLDCLDLLAQKGKELTRCEGHWRTRNEALEASLQ